MEKLKKKNIINPYKNSIDNHNIIENSIKKKCPRSLAEIFYERASALARRSLVFARSTWSSFSSLP